ncbi:hypothetical protein [Cytophaga aurantiaca]|uniref:hypothetical protein n=1 Tax=Cytophaga aurantiaca TaxID=29530 RepID=UPI0003766B69|nr:hypothetical protein [Cytophaga aurantiaca]
MNLSAKILSKNGLKLSLVALFLHLSFAVFSQPCPPGNPAGDPACDGSDPSLPFDGGASLLIAAGVGLIGKKALQNRKSSRSETL